MRVSFFRLVVTTAAASLALTACGSSSKPSSSSAATTVPTTAASPTGAPTSTAAGDAASGPAVALAQNPKIGKQILVDGKGITLYVWDHDTTPGTSACDANAQCSQVWPAFYVTGTPTYGAGLHAAMFSTIAAPNGRKQLAVNGKPLYYWFQDKAPGDVNGNDVNSFYVVGSDGNKIDES